MRHNCDGQRGQLLQWLFVVIVGMRSKARTRLLIVAAPIVLTSWTNSSMTKMTTSRDGILAANVSWLRSAADGIVLRDAIGQL